jgi:hypothetical protein
VTDEHRDPVQSPAEPAESEADTDAPPPREPLPPDPAAYDSPRAAQARARGLDAPYIAGGRDPQPEKGRREERFYLRLLIFMVVALVLSGFVLGIIGSLFEQVR